MRCICAPAQSRIDRGMGPVALLPTWAMKRVSMSSTVIDRVTLPIAGLAAGDRAAELEDALRAVPGVASVRLDFITSAAVLDVFPRHPLSQRDLSSAVASAGYTIPVETTNLSIGGMTCGSCVMHVEHALNGIQGVREARVKPSLRKGLHRLHRRHGVPLTL